MFRPGHKIPRVPRISRRAGAFHRASATAAVRVARQCNFNCDACRPSTSPPRLKETTAEADHASVQCQAKHIGRNLTHPWLRAPRGPKRREVLSAPVLLWTFVGAAIRGCANPSAIRTSHVFFPFTINLAPGELLHSASVCGCRGWPPFQLTHLGFQLLPERGHERREDFVRCGGRADMATQRNDVMCQERKLPKRMRRVR